MEQKVIANSWMVSIQVLTGAQWHPTRISCCKVSQPLLLLPITWLIHDIEFDAATYRKFMQLSRMHPKETGIMVIPSTDYYDELTPETTDPWFRHLVSDVSIGDLLIQWVPG